MNRTLPKILIGLFLVAGLLVLFYPTISNLYNAQYQIQAIVEYDDSIAEMTNAVIHEEFARAQEYNEALTGMGITDPFIPGGGFVLPENYTAIMDVNEGIMGSIEIPKIDVSLPIYHGTSAQVLEKGVGHMEMTAFPVGGEGTHAVLTGHTALPNAVLFSELDKLTEGDVFYIKMYNETLAYKVDQIEVVEPDNTKLLMPQPGKDYVTLVTCTPYAINSHRLLVRGVRIPFDQTVYQTETAQHTTGPKLHVRYDLIVAVAALAAVVVFFAVYLTREKKRKIYQRSRPATEQTSGDDAPPTAKPERAQNKSAIDDPRWTYNGTGKYKLQKEPFKRNTKPVKMAIAFALLILGAGVMAFPYVGQGIFRLRARGVDSQFTQRMQQYTQQEQSELYKQMVQYNQNLYQSGQSGLVDAFSYEQVDFSLRAFGFEEEMIGYISIPKIEVELPIYLGANSQNLLRGASHLSMTSLPVGGENTNAVIAAHRAMSTAEMFRNIDQLVVGDELFITNFQETLKYRVVEVAVIKPEEIDEILIQPGRDMVTLISCNPYGSSAERYVVYSERA